MPILPGSYPADTPEGRVLSPVLFSVMINEIFSSLQLTGLCGKREGGGVRCSGVKTKIVFLRKSNYIIRSVLNYMERPQKEL